MTNHCAKLSALAALMLSSGWSATTTGPSALPSSLSFSYTVNSTTLPLPATLTISLPSSVSSSASINVSPSYPAGTPATEQGWLSAVPASGYSPLKLTIMANPTGLPPGTLTAFLNISTTPATTAIAVTVTLTISNAPAILQVPVPSAASNGTPGLTFAYTTGSLADPTCSNVPSQQIDVTTNGGIIPFTVTVANVTGSTTTKSTPVWLRVASAGSTSPSTQTSGVAVAGSSVVINASIDPTSCLELLPGAYGATVTLAANNPANGTQIVDVTFVVSAGAPTVASIFPTQITEFTPGQSTVVNPVITVNGSNFFSTSVVTIAPAGTPSAGFCTQSGATTQLSAQVLSQTVISATVTNPVALFNASGLGPWCICVTNPAPANNPGQAPACATAPTPPAAVPTDYQFYVLSNTQLSVSTLTNAASYLISASETDVPDPVASGQTSIAPGEIISIFGQNLGPATPIAATAAPTAPSVSSTIPVPAGLVTTGVVNNLQFAVYPGTAPNNPITVSVPINSAACSGSVAAVIICINNVTSTTGGIAQNMASSFTLNGLTYLTLGTNFPVGPLTGSQAEIVVTNNDASQLLQLPSTPSSGSDAAFSNAFTYPGGMVQVAFQFGTAPNITTLFAPIIMISDNQVNAVVPFGVSAAALSETATIYITANGGTNWTQFPNSPGPYLFVVDEDPGIFTLTGQGTGQAAALNDSTSGSAINSAKSAAPRASTISIYATGLGILNPGMADGVVATTAVPTNDPVQVLIGGQPAVVSYAGTSPGSVGGLIQINAVVPPTVSPGQTVSLVVTAGQVGFERSSQSGVTIGVK